MCLLTQPCRVCETRTTRALTTPSLSTPTHPPQSSGSTKYTLNFLWMDKNIGVAVDQVYSKVRRGVGEERGTRDQGKEARTE